MANVRAHVQRMLDVIEQSYAEPVTLQFLAAALGRQASYLGSVFRRETGLSVRQCLTQVRLQHAAALIRDGVKIEAVALLVGYRSKKNFYRQFKRQFKMTPFVYGLRLRDAGGRDLGVELHPGGAAPMCDQDHFEDDRLEYEAGGLVTRRQFGVLLGAGMAMMLPQVVNAVAVTESDVTIKTPDGTCDAYFVRPATGVAPAVLMWPDIFGLRPAFRQMGKRLAETGYSVLVVNPFYRVSKAPTAEKGTATPIPSLMPLAQALTETTQMTDARAFIAWLDQQPSVDKSKKIGTQGYCMSGPFTFRTAAAVPDRVGAAASFHGGGLVTDQPNSPHLQVAKTKAQLLVAIASNDDMRSPNEKNVLRETFAKANVPAEVEVYAGAHGWCPPDSGVYSEPEAEKAWARLLALYSKALV